MEDATSCYNTTVDKDLLQCTDQALRYLSIREHNRRELMLKLHEKGFDSDIIIHTLELLEADGSLSEQRYIEAYVRSSNKRHPEGKSMVMARLLAKGVNRSVCSDALNIIYSDEYVCALIARASEKKDRNGLLKAGFTSADIAKYMLSKQDDLE